MFPHVNSMIDGDDIVSFDYIDISIAVSSKRIDCCQFEKCSKYEFSSNRKRGSAIS